MTQRLVVATVFAFFATTAGADLPQEILAKATAARIILDRYHQGIANVESDPRVLHLVYWTPSDREPANQYRQRLTRVMRHIQEFYANEMERIGFAKRTIELQEDNDGLLRIHFVKGARPYADYNKQSGGPHS